MIVAERKPYEEIKEMLSGYKKILIVGCGTCVSVCMAGGEKEVGILASELRMSSKTDGKDWEIEEATIERQCDREYIEPLKDKVEKADVILSMGCGVGVQFISEVFPAKIVLPALNTEFYGATISEGVWAERCGGCGNCILHLTGGICPVARCSKSLFNGPCGGSNKGKCEINPEIDCAWQLIYDRLKALGQLDKLKEIIPPRNWSTSRDGGPRKIIREDLKL